MFTQCPKCETVYSLSPADLRAANGYVRCGNCDTTFSALSRLQDTPPLGADDNGSAAPLAHVPDGDPEHSGEDDAPVESAAVGDSPVDEQDNGNADTQVLDESWSDELDEFEEELDGEDDWDVGAAAPAEADAAEPETEAPRTGEAEAEPLAAEAQSIPADDAAPTDDDAAPTDDAPTNDAPPAVALGPWTGDDDGRLANELGFRDVLLDDDRLFAISDEPESGGAAPAAETQADAAGEPPDAPLKDAAEGATDDGDAGPAHDDATAPAGAPADRAGAQLVDDAEDRRDIMNYLRPGLSTGQKIAGTLAAVLLLAVLAGQATHHFRSTLILDERIGPPLQTLYERIGLPITPAADSRDYEVARHTIVPIDKEIAVLQFRATIINRADGRRPFPSVRITFYDRFGDEGYVRTFAPREYLGSGGDAGRWLASGSAADVSLDFAGLEPDASTSYYVEACAPLANDAVRCAEAGLRR